MHARIVMQAFEGQSDTPVTDYLDKFMENLDILMATQLMKAASSLHATNSVKRSEDGGADFQ
jgi:hypothetical protein